MSTELTAFLLGVAYVLAALKAKLLREGWPAAERRRARREKLERAAIVISIPSAEANAFQRQNEEELGYQKLEQVKEERLGEVVRRVVSTMGWKAVAAAATKKAAGAQSSDGTEVHRRQMAPRNHIPALPGQSLIGHTRRSIGMDRVQRLLASTVSSDGFRSINCTCLTISKPIPNYVLVRTFTSRRMITPNPPTFISALLFDDGYLLKAY
jgi:hypothetical protein